MRGGSSQEVARHLRTLYQFGVAGSFSDEQLLDRFLASRDEPAEEAFAELVQRHGPMVLGVCRRILGDAHEAEDAFQATFLVLARKAASVARREKVASWLHGVAVRTAREARVRSARRRAREERVSTPIPIEPPDGGEFPAELREILDEELARLPARHRGPVVLCELEGLSRPEAARRLGIPEGTLSSRLSRAKARLRDRLSARGVALPAAAISAILIREARAVTVPLSLLESTVQAATLAAAGSTLSAAGLLSAPVASLSEGVIKTMLVAKLKGIALAAGALTAVVSGAVVLAQSGRPQPVAPLPVPAEAKVEALPPPQPPRVVVDGRADPDDRAAALEKKLDRVLEALSRLSPPGPPLAANPSPSAAPPPARGGPIELKPADRPARRDRPAPRGTEPRPYPQANDEPSEPVATLPTDRDPFADDEPAPEPVSPRPPTARPLVARNLANPTLADRLQALERQVQGVDQRLERLERQLKALDARVGGEGEARILDEPEDLRPLGVPSRTPPRGDVLSTPSAPPVLAPQGRSSS